MAAKKKERQELGVTLYAEQQSLALSQARLESVHTDLQAHNAHRLYREAEMNNIRKLYKTVAKEGDAMRKQGVFQNCDYISCRVVTYLGAVEP